LGAGGGEEGEEEKEGGGGRCIQKSKGVFKAMRWTLGAKRPGGGSAIKIRWNWSVRRTRRKVIPSKRRNREYKRGKKCKIREQEEEAKRGLFKASAVNEVDAERDRATPA
jgi:hypothetical protein